MNYRNSFLISLFLLVFTFVVFELSNLDLVIQDYFYHFSTHTWLIDQKNPTWRLLCYTGPKTLIIAFAASILVAILLPQKRMPSWIREKRSTWAVILICLAICPSLVAISKATTNQFSPYDIKHYNGNQPYVKVFEHYHDNDLPTERGRSFPAGHASGGFALMSLALLSKRARFQRIGLFIGITMGSWMGIYQMLKGAHYLSHTLVTAFFCWICIVSINHLKEKFFRGRC